MSAPRYARLAGKVLTEGRDGWPGRLPSPADRRLAIVAIEKALAIRGRRRLAFRALAAAVLSAAAAAAGLAVVGHARSRVRAEAAEVAVATPLGPAQQVKVTGHPVSGEVSVIGGGYDVTMSEGTAVPAGSLVVVPQHGRALLAFSTGTSVLLDPSSELRVESTGPAEALRLDKGTIELQVAKLLADQRFLVHTPDTEVEVRGTQFRVSLAPSEGSCSTATRVTVTEGVVVVRQAGSEVHVRAGEHWPSGCEASTEGASASSAAAGSTGPTPLVAQNDLFAAAVAAKRQGNYARAISGFDRLVAEYPNGVLAESAAAERMRLLRATDAARGKAAARDYLAKYRNGFARAEAQAIAGAP